MIYSKSLRRGASIPDWAYKDVLYMLIDYSIRSYELLQRPLNNDEKQEVLTVFGEVGRRMGLKNLPHSYTDFKLMRTKHLNEDLKNGGLSKDLYRQYRKHLGLIRYYLLIEAQKLLVPNKVRQLLNLRKFSILKPLVTVYKILRRVRLDGLLKDLLLPAAYKEDIKRMNIT